MPADGRALRHRLGGAGEAAVAVAAAVIALHVADDTWLRPRPGAAAADHLAAGLVPIAVIAALVWAQRHAGPRAGAALTACLGLIGLLVGMEAAHDIATGAASSDDQTGAAALVAGAALVVLGAVGLWRARRRDGPAGRRIALRGLVGLAALAVGAAVVLPLALGYGVTHIASPDVPEPALGAPAEDVTFRTADGVTLAGWYVPSRNGAAVVLLGMSRESPREEAAMLVRHGYGVLLYDQRGWGASEGDPNAFGWRGATDVAAAVAYVRARPDVDPDRVGGLGLSVGGEMMITGAAATPGLAAVVSEGAGERSVRETLDADQGWAAVPFQAAVTAAVALFSDGGPPPGLADLTPRIAPRPLLLIYGERGQPGERALNPVYAEAAGDTAALWEVPGAAHIGGLEARPAEYERRVVGFFDASLSGDGRDDEGAAASATAPDVHPLAP